MPLVYSAALVNHGAQARGGCSVTQMAVLSSDCAVPVCFVAKKTRLQRLVGKHLDQGEAALEDLNVFVDVE